jgi:hypothetical protein
MKTQNTVMESKSGRVLQYARRVALSAPGRFLLAAAVLISLVSVPLLTQANDREDHGQNEKRTLTGNWISTVTLVNPPPGQASSFLRLNTYFEDGNLLQEDNTSDIRSTGRGNWERSGHLQFTQSIIFFRFDAARIYVGTRVVTSTITLSHDGRQYQADSVVQRFDPMGNLLSTGQSTEVGQRF